MATMGRAIQRRTRTRRWGRKTSRKDIHFDVPVANALQVLREIVCRVLKKHCGGEAKNREIEGNEKRMMTPSSPLQVYAVYIMLSQSFEKTPFYTHFQGGKISRSRKRGVQHGFASADLRVWIRRAAVFFFQE